MNPWATLPQNIRDLINTTLADYPRQLEAWKLELIGRSPRSIAEIQQCNRTTVRDRLDSAHRRLRAAGLEQNRHGRFTIRQETP